MSRRVLLERYRNQALDRAAVIAALSLVRIDEYGLGALAERQDAQLEELLHDFAFRARKLIELTKRECLPSHNRAWLESIACSPVGTDAEEDLAGLSLWDVLNRVVHSDTFRIDRSKVPDVHGDFSLGSAAWGFEVTSERDRAGQRNFVFVEFFLKEFLAFDEALGRDLRRSDLEAPV